MGGFCFSLGDGIFFLGVEFFKFESVFFIIVGVNLDVIFMF